MGHGPRYRVPLRRRREGKTNYYKRFKLVISGKPRLVVRRSNEHFTVQVVEARIEGDRVIAAAHSRELVKHYGWLGDPNNTSAAYLVGLLAGYRARLAGVKEAVLDIGLHDNVKGARIYAALKGALDAGLEVPHGEEVIPGDDRIRGEHVAAYAEKLAREDPEAYRRQFSRYLKRGLKPEDLPGHFDQVVSKIREEYEAKLREAVKEV